MYCYRVVRTCPQDVIPQLTALLFRPGVGALVDWDDELRGFLQKGEQLGFSGFHLESLE